MTMEFTSLWEQAGDDAESAQREATLMQAQAAAADVWPFVSLAKSDSEFEHRLALAEDRISAVANHYGVSNEDITQSYRTAYTALREQRETEAQQHTASQHKEAGFPTCALGCGYTLSAQDDVVNIRHAHTGQTGMAHRTCFEQGARLAGKGHTGAEHTAAESPACRNCGHANPPHRRGGMCACGCDSYSPKTRGAGPRRAAQEPPSGYEPNAEKGVTGHYTVVGCPKCPESTGMYFDLHEGLKHCNFCEGTGRLIKRNDDSNNFMPAVAGEGGWFGPKPGAQEKSWGRQAAKQAAGDDSGRSRKEDRLNPEHPDYNDFDPNTFHEDTFGDGPRSREVNGVRVHEFKSTDHGYNQSQVNDNIHDGDVLSVPSENVHGFLYQAWPVASTAEHGAFHEANMEGLLRENPQYQRAHDVAKSLEQGGKTSSFERHIAQMRQALMDGQDPLEWVEEVAPSGSGQPEKPGGHTTQSEPYTYAEVPPGPTGGPGEVTQRAEGRRVQAGGAEVPDHHDTEPKPYTYAEVGPWECPNCQGAGCAHCGGGPRKEGGRPF